MVKNLCENRGTIYQNSIRIFATVALVGTRMGRGQLWVSVL